MFHFVILLILTSSDHLKVKASMDYWDDDFDEDKNCEKEELIKKLRRESGGERCAIKSRGNIRNKRIQRLRRDDVRF